MATNICPRCGRDWVFTDLGPDKREHCLSCFHSWEPGVQPAPSPKIEDLVSAVVESQREHRALFDVAVRQERLLQEARDRVTAAELRWRKCQDELSYEIQRRSGLPR